MPALVIEAAFNTAPFVEPSTWTRLDNTGNGMRRLAYRYGKAKRWDHLPPAELILTLANTNGRLDPMNPNSPYSPHVRRDTQIRVTLDTGDRSNIIGIDQAQFDGSGVLQWENNIGADVLVSRIQPGDGERSLKVTANATGRVSARTPGTGTAGFPVLGNRIYTFQAAFLSVTNPKKVTFSVQWYDSAGAALTSARSSLLAAPPTGGTFAVRHTAFTSPSAARFARMIFDTATADVGNEAAVGDTTYIRRLSIAEGPLKPWTIPGGIQPVIRGHALSWTANYDASQNDATCELVVTDVFRLLAEQKLWPSVFEHDLLGGHAGDPPVSYYPMDERANVHGRNDVVDKGIGRFATTSNGVRASSEHILQWDTRPFKAFGGGVGQGAQTMFVQSFSSQELDAAWSMDFMFKAERVGPPVQTIFNTSEDKLRLFIWEDDTLQFEVVYTDGTTAKIVTPFRLIPGPVEHVTLVAENEGTIELYMNRSFIGFVAGNGRIPAWWGKNLLIGADRGGGFGFRGAIGRLSMFTYRRLLGDHEKLNDAIKFPWGFNTNVGWRMKFLLEEFRHRKDTNEVTIPGSYPGVPASWLFIDDPSQRDVQDMNPNGRSLLEYMRALERTESGYLKVTRDGRIRFRDRTRRHPPKVPGIQFDNRMTIDGTVPYLSARAGSQDEVLSTVDYSITGVESNDEVQSDAAIAAYGEVNLTMDLESGGPGQARDAAFDVLDFNAAVPPRAKATVVLRPEDPRVGWAAAFREPGDSVRLTSQMPQYLHDKGYEILEVRHDASPKGWTTTLELTGNDQ